MRSLIITIFAVAVTACNKSDPIKVDNNSGLEGVEAKVSPIVDLESGVVNLLPGTDRSKVIELAGLDPKNGAKQLNYFATL